MKLHQKKKHPEDYNTESELKARSARTGWTEDEENELAMAEAELGENISPTFIINHLMGLSSRTRDAIKCRRKSTAYKEKVAAFKLQRARSAEAHSIIEEETTSAEFNPALPHEGIREFVRDIPEDELSEETVALREHLLGSTREAAMTALESWYQRFVAKYGNVRRGPVREGRHSRRKQLIDQLSNQHLTTRRRRVLKYKLAQMDFNQNPKRYAEKLLDGVDEDVGNLTPKPDEFRDHYVRIFEAESPVDDEGVDSCRPTIVMSDAITLEELQQAIKTSKSNSPGPDGLTLRDVSSIPIKELLLLFNAILLTEHLPKPMKDNRTILIPKTTSDRHEVKNWRPITISSVLLRLFNKILAHRLSSAVNLHPSQRGFSELDGCLANCLTVQTIIKHHRMKGTPLSIISLDLSKAFDSVSHHSIARALRRLGVDAKTRNIIMDGLNGTTTSLSCNSEPIGEFCISRGVKQGDPLSPILFNMVLDELLNILHEKTGVPLGETSKLCCMAYADDIVLCAQTPEDAERMLDIAAKFLRRRSLEINGSKSVSLVMRTLPNKKKLFVEKEPRFVINGERIPAIGVGDEFKYLGCKFTTLGLTACDSNNLFEQLSSIKTAPLKPQQKLTLIKQYLLPRYIAALQRPNINSKILKDVDKKLRWSVKRILHLPEHISNFVFHAPVKFGGLGLFCFEKQIPVILTNRIERLKGASQLLEDTVKTAEPFLRHLSRMAGDNTSTKDVRASFADGLESSYSGNGTWQMSLRKECNQYIYSPPRYWNGEEYIRAIHLRLNMLPSVGIPSNPRQQRMCRAGCRKTESLSHILQNCPVTHWRRIERHNRVLQRLLDAARRKGWQVDREPCVRGQDGLLKKPDAILSKGDKCIITDVGIHWEGPTNLAEQSGNKTAIYSTPPFIQKVQQLYPGKKLFVLPLIVGARGAWCALNDRLVHHVGLSSKDVSELINTCLRGGWTTHRDFMKLIWRTRHN